MNWSQVSFSSKSPCPPLNLTSSDMNNLETDRLAVFLHQLEYFKGLVILTTNRVTSIDPAFDSRFDICLYYGTLDVLARRRVWANFMKKIKECEISEDELDTLSEIELNGRQIKSVMKTACLLAGGGDVKEPVRFSHVKSVAKIMRGIKI
jgi:SpoVK/Ycf46/Vps4 family AAA+-type ATPase